MKFIQGILTVILIMAPLIGDYVVFQSKYSESQAYRAVTDSLTHASIGLISSILFFSYNLNISSQSCIYSVILCTLLSSLIDIDHVFVAKSFKLKDMTNLKQRGIFHCTTFCLLITLAILTYSYIVKSINTYVFAFTVFIAYMSHHLRDANRRGLWLYPMGHTPPLSKFLYVAHIVLLPHLFAYIFVKYRQLFIKHFDSQPFIA